MDQTSSQWSGKPKRHGRSCGEGGCHKDSPWGHSHKPPQKPEEPDPKPEDVELDYTKYRIPKKKRPGDPLREMVSTKNGELPPGYGMTEAEKIGKWVGLVLTIIFWIIVFVLIKII